MKPRSSKEIKDRYGAFAETARREPRPTLVTISIDRARSLPGLRGELDGPVVADRQERLARLLEMGGVGVGLVCEQTRAQLAARGRAFRGD
jgi:hypothetical protein